MNEIAELVELPGRSGEKTFTKAEMLAMGLNEKILTRSVVERTASKENIEIEIREDPLTGAYTIRWNRDTP